VIEFVPGVKPKDRSRARLFAEDYYHLSRAVNFSNYAGAQFPMYGNNLIGDCTFAGLAHLFGAWTYYAQGQEVIFNDLDIVRGYSAVSGYDPITRANDNGCTLEEVLRYGRTVGLRDPNGLRMHRLDAYAEIRNLTYAGLSEALSLFGGVYIAVDLPASAVTQFNAGEPWEFVPGSPSLGGHCITLQQVHGGKDSLGFTTLGKVQPASREWVYHYVTEAWAAYSREFLIATTGLSPSGLDETRLINDMQGL